MTLHLQPIPPVPDAPAAPAEAIFPAGNVDLPLRAAWGTRFTAAPVAPWVAAAGRPVEVAPWRPARGVGMPHLEGLTDHQAADAVRRWIDWQYVLGLEVTDPGFDFTRL